MEYGIKSIGAYLPYRYLPQTAIGAAWGSRGGKGFKSVADVDEDSITMAVEAGMGCFRFFDRKDVSAVYFATITAPYAEKLNSALISVACDLQDDKVFSADVTSSTRAGTNALKMAVSTVRAEPDANVLVTAADVRLGYPKSAQESRFGDGAAAVIVGAEENGDNLMASIDYMSFINEEINDYWRNSDEKYTRHAEARFCDEAGYLGQLNLILKKVLKETGLKTEDFAKAVVVGQQAKTLLKFCTKNKITPEQTVSTLLSEAGDTGSAQALLGIVNALENAEPGQKILVLDYGNGAGAAVLTVKEGIRKLNGAKQIERYLGTRAPLDSYARYLSWRGIAQAEPGTPYKVQPSWAQTWREQRINLRLHGSVCRKCGSALFPINRVCDCCGSKDDYDEFSAQEDICRLYTFSIDEFAGQSDDPVIIQAVAETANGAHVYTLMTDFVREEVKTDMECEFTFRRFNELGNFPNYFWKLRPLRREQR